MAQARAVVALASRMWPSVWQQHGHHRAAMLSVLPSHALASAAARRCSSSASLPHSAGDQEERRKLINKLLYRSKQRGWLELDLLVGMWAEEQIPRMDVGMLQSYANVLEEENPDLFKWLTGQLQAPERMLQNPAFVALRGHVQQQMADNSNSATHASSGKEWVRGWDDAGDKQAAAGAATSKT